MPNVSIIITCGEGQSGLRSLLPDLLSMQYEGDYEVIVVDEMHDKDLKEWLEEMEVHYPNLTHTFCSTTARGIDIHRLALTLGAKAAINEWLVVLPSILPVPPLGGGWLDSLVACIDDQADVVVCTQKGKRRWNWFTSYFFRRRFSLFRPSPHIILCRRSIVLQGKANFQIVLQ